MKVYPIQGDCFYDFFYLFENFYFIENETNNPESSGLLRSIATLLSADRQVRIIPIATGVIISVGKQKIKFCLCPFHKNVIVNLIDRKTVLLFRVAFNELSMFWL